MAHATVSPANSARTSFVVDSLAVSILQWNEALLCAQDLRNLAERGLLEVADLHPAKTEKAAFGAGLRYCLRDLREPALEGWGFARRLLVDDLRRFPQRV